MTTQERRSGVRGARSERAIVRVNNCQINSDKNHYISNCKINDVSANGISVFLDMALPDETKVDVWLEIKGFQRKFLLSGLVRWCHLEMSGQWLCGIEFCEENVLDIADWRKLFLSLK